MIESIIKEWLNNGGDEKKLLEWLENNSQLESNLITKNFKSGLVEWTATEIMNYLQLKTKNKLSIRLIGIECKKQFKRKMSKNKGFVYLISII
jgi:hypothetical protein